VDLREGGGDVIRKEFGVLYHPAHVSRLLRALGLSLQKPERRANQREEEAIERWKQERWPELKRGQVEEGRGPSCLWINPASTFCLA
jgi:hypothetical protein